MKKLDIRSIPVLARERMSKVEYPALYVQAKEALKQCVQIDEIKDIRDKHDALAHYAKQAKDDSLMHYAERIKLRALERIGQILLEFPEGKERTKAYKDRGIAPQTAGQAMAIASVPERVRNTMIDGPKVPLKPKRFKEYMDRHQPLAFYEHTRRESTYKFDAQERTKMLLAYLHETINEIVGYICAEHWTKTFTLQDLARAMTPEQVEEFKILWARYDDMFDEVDMAIPKVDPRKRTAV